MMRGTARTIDLTDSAQFLEPIAPVARAGARPAGGSLAGALAAAALLALGVQAALAWLGIVPVLDGVLVDADAYLRLVRVEHLWATGDWFASDLPRIDPPNGFVPHWTRPLDALLLAGASLARPWLPFREALYWWGVLLGPVMQIVAMIAFVWAAAPLIRRAWLPWAGFVFAAQPAVFAAFLIGRPDHHGVLALLTILMIGYTLRSLRASARAGPAVGLGLVGGLAVWVSVEALVPLAVSFAAFGLAWLRRGGGLWRAPFGAAGALVATTALALLLERGTGGVFVNEVDRLSGAHLFLFAVNLGFWTIVGLRAHGAPGAAEPAWRLGAGLAGVLGAVGAIAVLQPGLIGDPMASADVLYNARHMAYIEELQPVLGRSANGAPWTLAGALLWLGLAIPALPWLAMGIARAPGARRRAWGFIALGALVFLPLAAAHRRWAVYPEIYLAIPYTALVGYAMHRLGELVPRGLARRGARPIVAGLLCLWVYAPAAAIAPRAAPRSPAGAAAACPIRALAPVLNDPAGLGARPRRVLAFIDVGPEILYRTPHAVLSVPNHRYQAGFATAYRIMTTRDPARARRLLQDAGIEAVLVCPRSAESWFYRGEGGNNEAGAAPSLFTRLATGRPPAFLRPVQVPDSIKESVKLYEVMR